MDRILVVFYSYTGTCRQLAQRLCAQLDWPVGEIVEVRSRAGAAGTVRCVLDTLLRRRPAIRYAGADLRQYEAVVLVSPIWLYGLAGPMRSFVAAHAGDLPQVAVISVMGSGGASNAVGEVDRLLGRSPLIAAAFTAREVEDGSCANRLQAFGRALRQASPADGAIEPDRWSANAG